MSSKSRGKDSDINVAIFENLIIPPGSQTQESETDPDTSAFNSSPSYDVEEEEEEEDEEEPEKSPSPETSLSDSLQFKLISKDKALISLQNDSKFFLKGQVQLKVLKGKLEILGHTLTSKDKSFRSVYSPKGYSLLYCHGFLADDDVPTDITFTEELIREGLNQKDCEDFNEASGCIFVARKLQEPWSKFLTDQLRQTSKMNLLYRDQSQSEENIVSLEKALDINLYQPEAARCHSRVFRVGETWELALQSVAWCQTNRIVPRILVAGGKGVGKSTFVRWLTNKLVSPQSPLVLLDLDPGQTELGLPGYLTVSLLTQPLLGPNFTHVGRVQPCHSVFLGDISVANCPDRNINIIHDLWEYIKSNLSQYPLVVNTMGWCNGMGLMMLVDTIRLLEPTTVIQLQSRYRRKNFPFSLTDEAVGGCREGWRSRKKRLTYNLLEFPAVPESATAVDMRSGDNWGLPEPRQLRDLVVLAWLGRTGWPHWPQYSIPLSSLALAVINADLEPGALLAAANLSLVDLCRLEKKQVNKPRARPELYSVARRGVRSPSLGVGLVTHIDTSRHCLHLATPLPLTKLAAVNCLLVGQLKLPVSVLSSAASSSHSSLPYLDHQSDNPLHSAWQRYHKPRA